METINGEWIMLGCDPEDPACLHDIAEAIDLIHRIGLLPLFSNSIEGFSLEERVPSFVWWTGDPATDPWEWRQILACHPDIAYGKFMNRAAGFISKSFFPTFANYRRDGYDYDALFDDGRASFRSKKIMDVFCLDDEAKGKELMTPEIKSLAGFGRGGEKNFEGTLADLQMQTYLILSGFCRKKNRKGKAYGWHIAKAETPETKWGRDFVTRAYSEEPYVSRDKITDRVRRFFPEAGEKELGKILGIKRGGGLH